MRALNEQKREKIQQKMSKIHPQKSLDIVLDNIFKVISKKTVSNNTNKKINFFISSSNMTAITALPLSNLNSCLGPYNI